MAQVTVTGYNVTRRTPGGLELAVRGVYCGVNFGGFVYVSAEMFADGPALMDFLKLSILTWAQPAGLEPPIDATPKKT